MAVLTIAFCRKGDKRMRAMMLGLAFVLAAALPAGADDKNKGKEDSYIKVEVLGTVTTGVMAIGAETTGVTITTKDGILELEVQGDLAKEAEKVNGKKALVKGKLTLKQGVEMPGKRLIVKVESLKPAEGR
jgi:hypothetical protein